MAKKIETFNAKTLKHFLANNIIVTLKDETKKEGEYVSVVGNSLFIITKDFPVFINLDEIKNVEKVQD